MVEQSAKKKLETKTEELEKPSKSVQSTNFGTAYYRSFSDIPNSKALAELVMAKENSWITQEGEFENQKSIIPFFEARYKAIDCLIQRSGVKQVVEFAAGLTTRGINNPQWNYIHTDQDAQSLSQMEQAAKVIFKGSGKLPHFVKFDAITGEGMDAIISNLNNSPLAIVHEGLMTYYGFETKAKIAMNAKRLLERFGGVYITPDIHIHDSYVKMLAISPNHQERQKKHSERVGRDLASLRFKTQKEAEAFFSDLGFNTVTYKLGELVPSLSCVDVLFDDPKKRELVSSTILGREIWLLTLK